MTKNKYTNLLLQTLGCFISAAGIYSFAVAAEVPVTGIAGICAILYRLFGIPMGLSNVLINIPIILYNIPPRTGNKLLPETVQALCRDVDVIVGPAMGGIVYAYELGRQMGKRAIFTERVDNVMTLKRFRINPGERCIIAEDVVTTGVSSLETKRVIKENGGICVGIACVVDRTRAEAPSPIPIVASALKLDLPNYAPEECPICKEGKLPLVHLGSRKMKEAAKQTL